jgi:hypothetical protein
MGQGSGNWEQVAGSQEQVASSKESVVRRQSESDMIAKMLTPFT